MTTWKLRNLKDPQLVVLAGRFWGFWTLVYVAVPGSDLTQNPVVLENLVDFSCK